MSGTSIRLRIPGELADRLRARCRREGAGNAAHMALRLLDQHVDEDIETARDDGQNKPAAALQTAHVAPSPTT